MQSDFPLFPEAASSIAKDVDAFYLGMVALSGALTLVGIALVIGFAVKYRRRPGNEVPVEYKPLKGLEWGFIVILFLMFMGMFFVSARMYFHSRRPPTNALDVYVTGKQWMWKFQHVTGQSEINMLHVPKGRPVRLIMASEDVIHSFYIPAFRIKMDVLPNRYTHTWFEATKAGTYHLFCTEYCGTSHSGMIGSIVVMEPDEFQNWLAGGSAEGAPASEGKKLFTALACNTCHMDANTGRGPVLTGLYNQPVKLRDGSVVTADDNYMRESILNPSAKVVAGFEPIMPSFQGQVNEAQVMQLVAYIRTLTPQQAPSATVAPPAAPKAPPAATDTAASNTNRAN
jgi:cytochrome c oxidase subunit 2